MTTTTTNRQAANKQSPDERTRATTRALHGEPYFDLTVERWIPVIRAGGTSELLGLGDTLRNAHKLVDLGEPHPLCRAGLRRFLQAVTAHLVRLDGGHHEEWAAMLAGNSGFTDAQVDRALAEHAEHLWLLHPKTPFLQDPRLLTALDKPASAVVPVFEAVPNLPNELAAAWFAKRGEPALIGGLPLDETARWLTCRWFYAMPGNGPTVHRPGRSVISHLGGPFAEGRATVTHVWRTDPASLFRTLLSNLTFDLVRPGRVDEAGCAWRDPRQPQLPRGLSDALYGSTVTTTAALICGRDANNITHLLRGAPSATPRTVGGNDLDKQVRDLACDRDPYRLVRVTPARRQGDRAIPPARTTIRIEPTLAWADLLRQLYRDGFDRLRDVRGVARDDNQWLQTSRTGDDDLELLLATKSGSTTSPNWAYTVTARLPLAAINPSREQEANIAALAATAFDPQTGVYARLATAVSRLFAPRGEPGTNLRKQPQRGLLAQTRLHWLDRAEGLLRAVLTGARTVDDDWEEQAFRLARAAYDTVFAPYLASVRYAGPFAKGRAALYARSIR